VIRIDASATALEPERLRQALRGERAELSATGALGLLSDPDLEIDQRTGLLADTASSPGLPDGVRAIALRVLATVDPARALVAARDVDAPQNGLADVATLTIGLLGGEDDRVKADGPERPAAPPVVRFGGVLLAHRFGRSEGALDVTGFATVPASRGASERFVGSPAGAITGARAARAARQQVPWLEEPTVTDVVCAGRTLSVVTSGRVLDGATRRGLAERPGVAGVIVTETKVSEVRSGGRATLAGDSND
jgi:hypothetical protein